MDKQLLGGRSEREEAVGHASGTDSCLETGVGVRCQGRRTKLDKQLIGDRSESYVWRRTKLDKPLLGARSEERGGRHGTTSASRPSL